jgi:1-acyl-sn-glycerol-3-phosphate acyltransferase
MITLTTLPTRKLKTIALLSLAALTVWTFREPLAALMALLQDQQALSAYVQGLGSVGPLMLFGLLVAQVFLAIIPGHALMMAGGYLYGPVVAITITATSTILGSQIAFQVARRYGRELIYRLAKSDIKVIEKWDRIAQKQGALFFFFTFVLPIFPSDLMCYVAGLGKVAPHKFLAANIAGRILCAIAITMIGAYGFQPPWQFWAVALGGMTMLFMAWGVYKNRGGMPRSKSELAHVLGMWIMNTYRRIFSIQICVNGLTNVPSGAKILVANHPNLSDAYLLPLLFDGKVRFLAQATQFRTPVMGWILKHSGQIPVRTGRRAEAYQEACQALANGDTVVVFPEGRLNPDNKPVLCCSGAVRMALSSGAPILPMGIHVSGLDTLNVSLAKRASLSRKRWQVGGKFVVHIGKPWSPGAMPVDRQKPSEVKKLTQSMMKKVQVLKSRAVKGSEK